MIEWLIIPSYKYLVHFQECDQEDNTIEYSVYKYENEDELLLFYSNLLEEEFPHEPYDGGWYTIDSADISEAIKDAPNCVIDELVDYICDTLDMDEDTPEYYVVCSNEEAQDDNISTDED